MRALLINFSKSFFIFFLSFFLISADLHFNTSASMRYKDIKIKYLDETLTLNLDSPGVKVQKYDDGRLKRLTVHKINSVIELYFHQVENGPERVAMVQNFRVFNGLLLLDGSLQRLSVEGNLLSESNWEKGLLHGKQSSFDSDQNIIEEKWFDEGLPIKTWQLYYSSGTIASTINFPKQRSEWEKTLIKNQNFSQKTSRIHSSPHFYHPLIAHEKWFSPSGKLIKKTEYQLHKTPQSFAIMPNGKWQLFDNQGKLVATQDTQYDKKIHQQYYSSLGRIHQERETWLDNRLFKAQSYQLLDSEALFQE